MNPALVLALGALAAVQADPFDEGRFYAVDYLTPPDSAVLEVGGMDFLPDGKLVVSTRRGEVWMVENPLADDPAEARFSLFAEGLWEGLGLAVVDGEIFVLQRGELSRLRDVDGDGVCDDVDTLADGWGLSGNYHEFAYGLPVDDAGNFYVTLNVSFLNPKWWHGKSNVPYRGWALRISPDGEMTPYAAGFRSPAGPSLSPTGEFFVTDNQGDWMPASPIFRVRAGGFYGHPASLDWTEEYRTSQTLASDTIPPARAATDREPAAIWLPYEWSRSPGNLVWDRTAGRFGPFAGQAFVAELTNGMILRAGFQEVNGVLQGWVLPFRRKVGSSVRVLFAPDGTLLLGFTNRGWGGLAPADGIGRIRWTGATPLEILDVELLGAPTDVAGAGAGFGLRFTKSLAPDLIAALVADPGAHAAITQYDYDYWWEYGSPERDATPIEIVFAAAGEDELGLWTSGLQPGRMTRIELAGLVAADGAPLLHDTFVYTVNQLPGGEPTTAHVVKIVPPPPARESDDEGWLRLTYGDATDAWHFEGWELVAASLDPDDPTRFVVQKGNSHLTNTASETPSEYVSKAVFGDAEIHVEFTLPAGGTSAVLVQGLYGILLADTQEDRVLTSEHCGAILPGRDRQGHAPALHAYRGPGQLHELDLLFLAPRFDAEGNKLANARFRRVRIDDVLLHEDVELPGPSADALGPELAEGPLVLVGTRGPVAFGNVRVRPLREGEPEHQTKWVPLVDFDADDPLEGWFASEDGIWTIEDDVLVGEGPRSHLFSPRGDYRDFELFARLKISDGGNSGLYFRVARTAEGWPSGYEAQINSSFADPQKTGSLYGLAPLLTHLIAPDTWFDYHVTCRDEPGGTRITIRVNGVVVNEHVDTERRHATGHVALQQHHDGSVLEVKELAVREP